ncbi:3-phosphoshikimate 1-carboxyvinyltransferase [Alteromonas gilva]|uniref:3-phosphoshikimate 1-carboxyvinyltransferase n=1 Tax=Alteromonas gilva TaxID=2987522 RepID=A0ABT5L4U0_9ALTE|nr:3-phosphoshikimate 1-carboxyvinyltransferase [Alteromonas gilva]MDC8830783.1 3-phosphoshikimate 1-carboxyvinyltransferase [Alteromonas gilva]
MQDKNIQVKDEAAIKHLLSRMPASVANSFTDRQLMHLKVALGARQWGKHKVDFRGTFPVPFMRSRIYYVFLMGRNFRELSRREQVVSAFSLAVFMTLFITFSVLMGILVLYLIKSALGINIFKDFSFGIWDWFKALWQ